MNISSDAQHIISSLFTQVNMMLQSFVFREYTNVSEYMSYPLATLSTLYIMFFSVSIMIGKTRVHIVEFITLVLKIALVNMAVMNWGFVSEYIYNFFCGIAKELGSAIITSSPLHIPGFDGDINTALQNSLNAFTSLGNKLIGVSSLSNWSALFEGLLFWIFGFAIVGLAMLELILAKVMIALLIVFTPLIVVFCFFKTTQGIFDRWLGSIIGFVLLQLFVMATLGMAISLMGWYVAPRLALTANDLGNAQTLPIIILGMISFGLILKASVLAQNIGSTCSSHSSNAMLGAMVTSTLAVGTLGPKKMMILGKAGKAAFMKGVAMKGMLFKSKAAASTVGKARSGLE